jgi:hypothetical protein
MPLRAAIARRWPTAAVLAWLAVMTIGRDAPATIEEQRARLPPPVDCMSPVAGRWKALNYRDRDNDWYEYILEIHEDPNDPTRLIGRILIDTWLGDSTATEPPNPCRMRLKGKMEGAGSFVHGEVAFGATTDFEYTEIICGPAIGYNPDHFTGHLQPELEEFQAINNDGGMAVNEPTVFRRIGCLDSPRKEPSQAELAPPPFFPKRRSGC